MAYDKLPTMRGHTLTIGGELVTLWPVEIAGENALPPDGAEVIWFRHTEADWSEPCQIEAYCRANRWGWAFCSDIQAVRQVLEDGDGFIELKRRDREALAACGSANI